MVIYFAQSNKLFITITGSFKNLKMCPEIENTVYDPKSWGINMYNCPSLTVQFEPKKMAILLLLCWKVPSSGVEPSAWLILAFELFNFHGCSDTHVSSLPRDSSETFCWRPFGGLYCQFTKLILHLFKQFVKGRWNAKKTNSAPIRLVKHTCHGWHN